MNRARWKQSVFARALSAVLSASLVLGGPWQAWAHAAAMQRPQVDIHVNVEDSSPKKPTVLPKAPRAVSFNDVPEVRSGPHAAAVLPVPLLPTSVVQVSPHAKGDPWTLFDGRPSTTIEATAGEPSRIEVTLREPTKLAAMSLLGPAEGTMRVFAQGDGFELRAIEGWGNASVRVPAGTWKRIEAHDEVLVQRLVIEWTANTRQNSQGPAEIGLWGFASPRRGISDTELADRILSGAAPGAVAVRATPSEGRVARVLLGSSAANEPALFRAMLDVDPRSFSRAFLVYELAGLGHWTEAVRQINGLSIQGGARSSKAVSSAMGEGGLQVEEIAPSSLHRGENEIRFLQQPSLNAPEYGVRHVRIVGVPLATVVENPPGAEETKPRRLSLGGPSQAHDLVFELPRATDGHMLVRAAGAKGTPLRVDLKGLEAGWHRVDVGRLPVTNAVSIELGGATRPSIRSEGDRRTVSDLAMTATAIPRDGDAQRIAVSYPLHGECVDHKAHVRGFVATGDPLVAFAANGSDVKTSVGEDKAFSLAVPEPDFFRGQSWDVALQATLASGKVLQRTVRVGPCLDSAKKADAGLLEDEGAPFGEVVHAGEAKSLAFGGAKLEIPEGAIEKDVRITVRPLVPAQVPAMSRGMANVSPDGRAFRFGPHGLKFKKPVKITLPYDRASLREGMHERHIFSFYYDEPLGKWQRIGRVGGADNGELAGLTEHFTDFVNATLAMPDSPGPASFNPNEMKGVKLGSPSEGIDAIEAPAANASGAATMVYPIEVPPGRNGVEPQLAFTYNSEKTNGWLGVGWDVAVSSIEIDTRFGVPTYGDPRLQGLTRANRYLLDGEQLVFAPKSSSDIATFKRRVERSFDRIERLFDSNQCVVGWRVTDKNGTVFTYGDDPSAVFADPDDPCRAFRWGLRSVRDAFGNRMQISYVKDTGTVAFEGKPGDRFVELYLASIDYTSNDSGLVAPYHVKFERDAGNVRLDVTASGRSGFLERTRHRLDHVDVLYGNTIIRRYQLGYEPPTEEHFKKSLLASIAIQGVDHARELDRHTFDYRAAEKDTTGIKGFDPVAKTQPGGVPWGALNTDHPLGRGTDSLAGLSGEIGIGFGPFSLTVGGGGTSGGQTTHRALFDLNGDSTPDFVIDNGNTGLNFLRPYLSTREPTQGHILGMNGVGLSSLGDSKSSGWSIEGKLSLGPAGVGANYSRTSTEDDKILTDFDGDGRTDYVTLDDGQVHFFKNVGNGKFEGTNVGGTALVPSGNKPDGAIAQNVADSGFRRISPLLRWVAPFDGNAMYSGAIHKLRPGGNGVMASVYHAKRTGTEPIKKVWEHFIPPADSSTLDVGISLTLAAGDRIYTTLTPFHDPAGSGNQLALETQFNDVEWNPTITYSNCEPWRVEPDGSPVCVFSQKADHRVAGQPKVAWTAMFGDEETRPIPVHVEGTLVKDTTSDDVYYSVVKTAPSNGGTVDIQQIVPPTPLAGSLATAVPISADAEVLAGQGIEFRLSSQMPIDPKRLHWMPSVTYRKYCKIDPADQKQKCGFISCTDPTPTQPSTCTMEGDPVPAATVPPALVKQIVQVVHSVPQLLPHAATTAYVVPTSGSLRIHASASPGESDPGVTLLIQGVNQLYARQYVPSLSTGQIDVTIQANAGEQLFATAFLDGEPRGPGFPVTASAGGTGMHVNVRYRDASFDAKEPDNLRPRDPMAGGFHRWFTGFYNGEIDFSESGILFPFDTEGRFRTNPPTFQLAAPKQYGVENDPSPAWTGPGSTYVIAGQQSCSRASLGASFGTSGKLQSLRASTTWNVGYGGDFVLGSIGASQGASNSDHDFFDFNGDHYPDAVSLDGVVQFNNAGEGFLAPIGIEHLGNLDTLRRVNHGSVNVRANAGLILRHLIGGDDTLLKSILQGFSVGADYGQSSTPIDWVDVNGDSLPDYVQRDKSSDFTVRLNYGYRLGNEIPWKSGTWTADKIVPKPFGKDGRNIGNDVVAAMADNDVFGSIEGTDYVRMQDTGSISGGANYVFAGGGVTANVTRTLVDLVDVTGDGLPDQVMKNPEKSEDFEVLRVRQNLGDRFDSVEQRWVLPSWAPVRDDGDLGFLGGIDDALQVRRSTTYSADFSFKICFFICVGISGFWSRGTNMTYTSFEDIDGDALPDMIYKGGDPNVYTKLNKLGGVNLLETVHRPLGGSIALRYEREGNLAGRVDFPAKVDEPGNKYVLAQVGVDDGRGNRYVRTIEHDPSGFHDRTERADYGFAKVTTTLADGSIEESDYFNQDFYRKSRVAQELTRDAQGMLFTSSQTVYADPGTPPLTSSFFPKELSRTSNWYEGETSDLSKPRKSTTENRTWDGDGNLTDFEVLADEGPADDVFYHLEYDPTLRAEGIVRVSEVTANSRTSTTPLRARKATYYPTGALKTMTHVVIGGKDPATGSPYTGDPATNPTWQYRYDPYGNLQETTDPRGYTITYAYDDIAHSYRTSTMDSFGYISTSVPNYYFGEVAATNDVNKQSTLFHYDDFGRLVRVYSPNDDINSGPTIAVAYSQQGPESPLPAYALTTHKDVLHPGDPLTTVTFADGLGRVIQTKKDVEKDTGTGTVVGMSVSGLVTYDARGRVAQQGQPIFDTSAPENFVTVAMKNPTSYTYDVLDRTRSEQTPDGAFATTAYGFEALDGTLRFATTVRDPNVNAGGGLPGAAKTSYSDVRGLVLGMKEANRLAGNGPRVTLVTRYTYDPLEQLVQVTDAKGHVTTADYDTMGRMVSLTSPDSGRTDWSFDLSGNLGSKQTARLRGTHEGIRYHYDFNRLRTIEYPYMPAVTYAYGDAAETGDSAGNRAGRIVAEISEAGTKSYQYDRLGNVAEQRWVLKPLLEIPPEETYDRTMSWNYDSFGRLLSMQYPGEEKETVTYGYDRGGNVTSAVGVTPSSGPGGGSTTTPYLNFIGYDEYEQRTRVVAGNGITTGYVYDPLMRRLKEVNADYRDPYLVFRGLPPRPMQRLRYEYDPAGNITQVRNDAPFDPDRAMTVAVGTLAQNFTYDDLYQLKTADGVHQEDDPWRTTYGLALTYDDINNIVKKAQRADHESFFAGQWEKDHALNDVTYTGDYTYAGSRPHAPTQVVDTLEGAERTKTRAIEYDLNGNQAETRYGSIEWKRSLSWDEEDRLKNVVEEDNMQLSKALYDAAGSRAVNLQWLEEETASFGENLTLRDGKVPTKHIFAGGTRIASKTGEGPEWVNPSTTVYAHDDHLGSVNYVTSSEQEIVAHEEYFPTGELWVDESNPTVKVGPKYSFSGKELDAATGLYYFGARQYDSRLSMWNSPDPAMKSYMQDKRGAGMHKAQNLGTYTYAWNRPTLLRDPTGRSVEGFGYDAFTTIVRTGTNALIPAITGALFGLLFGGPAGAAGAFLAVLKWQVTGLLGVPLTLGFAALGGAHGYRLAQAKSYRGWKGAAAFAIDNTWSVHNSFVGSLFSALTYPDPIDAKRSEGSGQLYLQNRLLRNYDTTLGNVTTGTGVPRHEGSHVWQSRMAGPSFYPVIGAFYVLNTVAPWWLIAKAVTGWPKNRPIQSFGEYFTRGVYPYIPFETWSYGIEGYPQ